VYWFSSTIAAGKNTTAQLVAFWSIDAPVAVIVFPAR
jgi:hypothetical protein